ncbi:isochorismatase family protein, partial [Streptomyces sp. NPDC002920]
MPSPDIVPYAMPGAPSLPVDGPAWSIDPRRTALLVQDVQKYLLRDLRDSAPVGELLANIGRLTRSARSAGVPVVYAVRVPGQRGSGGSGGGGAGFGVPEPPAEADAVDVAEVVRPQTGDTVLTVKRYSAFAGTRLRARLKELGRDQLV